ncbi:MAG: hypothetical protein ACK58M_07435 [Acidobacteriota bacterium]|jgi:hypothetical protein
MKFKTRILIGAIAIAFAAPLSATTINPAQCGAAPLCPGGGGSFNGWTSISDLGTFVTGKTETLTTNFFR